MAEAPVIITLSVKDAASNVLKAIGKSAKEATDKAVKGLDKFIVKMDKVGKVAGKVGKVMSVGVTAPLAVFAGVAVNSAVKAERLTNTLDGLAGGSERAATFIDAIKDASLGTIPQIEALEIANRALSFGVVKSADEMADLTEIAITLGRAQGLTASQAVSDLTTALSRQSPMILDNLGITLKLTEAYDIYAAKLGITVAELDANQKAEAFRTAALIKGGEVVERMGGLQDDMAASGERVKAQISDLAVTVGASLIPVLQVGINVAGPLVEKFTEMSGAGQKTVIMLAAIAAGIGPALSAFGALTGGIIKAKAAFVAIQATSGASALALGALGVAVIALVAVTANSIRQLNEMKEAQEAAKAAAASLGEETNTLVDGGADLTDTLEMMGNRLDKAADEINNLSNVEKIAMNATGGYAKANEAFALATDSLQESIIANVDTFKEYTAEVVAYDAGVDDARAKLLVFSEAQFNMIKIMQDGASAQSMASDELLIARLGLEDSAQATSELVAVQDQHTLSARDNLLAIEDLSSAEGTSIETKNRLRDITQQSAEAQAAAVAKFEQVARVTEMSAEASRRQAEAMAIARGEAILAAEAQTQLASSLMNATEQQIAQTLIDQLDPEALGATAYAKGVEQIQLAFGLADEESIALATNVTALSAAVNDGIIPYENYDEALAAIIAGSKEGITDTGLLLDEFARAPGLIGPSKDALENLNERLIVNSDESVNAADGLTEFGDSVGGILSDVSSLTSEVEALGDALANVGNASLPSGVSGGNTPREQHGGIVPGPIGGPPRLVLAEPGELFIPPSQIKGPTDARNFSVTNNNTFPDKLSTALFLHQQEMETRTRFERRM